MRPGKIKLPQFVDPYGGGLQWGHNPTTQDCFVLGIRQTLLIILIDVK